MQVNVHMYIIWIFCVFHYTRHISAPLSLSNSIVWNDCEDILEAGTEVVRSEDTECLSDIDAVRIWHRHCSLICHIVDEDRVPDIRINISHIQREWSTPWHGDRWGSAGSIQISHWWQETCWKCVFIITEPLSLYTWLRLQIIVKVYTLFLGYYDFPPVMYVCIYKY